MIRLEDVKPGDRLVADGGFTCIREGAVLVVTRGDDGCLEVPCLCGGHGLNGQVASDGHLIGLARALDDDPSVTVTIGDARPFVATLSAMLADEELAEDEAEIRAKLAAGEVYHAGGGAGPLVRIERAG